MEKSFKQLKVWQKSINLVKEIYALTEQLPKSEMYGLSSQMRRSVVSIPSNIAEGYKRKNRKEYIQFLSMAEGSSAELETQLIICKEIYTSCNYLMCENLLIEVQKMLYVLLKKLKGTAVFSSLQPYNPTTLQPYV